MKNKFVVYTALFGHYDNLIEPCEGYKGCDFICFTDQKNLKSDIWNIRIVSDFPLSPALMNRKYKILPHLYLNNYDESLYIDTNIAIIGSPIELKEKYLSQYDLSIPKHFSRNCLYKEAKECMVVGKSNIKNTLKQINHYKKEGFPENFGLGENGIILRKHNKKNIISMMEEWWGELNRNTKRDQLSLAYILWKSNTSFNFMQESARNNSDYFLFNKHIKDESDGFFLNVKNKFIFSFNKLYIIIFSNQKRR